MVEKKPRKPRTKKIVDIQQTDIKPEILIKVLQADTDIKQQEKQKIILGIDPAFKNCGIGILNNSYVEKLRPDVQKLTQSEVDGYIAIRAQQLIKQITDKYDIEYCVIELQLGQFSADRIQLAFVQALPNDCKYVVQHSKLKLNQPEKKGMEADNKDSNKYHQNKHLGRDLIKVILKDQLPDRVTFDEADALLHGIYVFRNPKKVQFFQKNQLLLFVNADK